MALLHGAWPAKSASSPSAKSSISTKKDCANRKPASMTSRPTYVHRHQYHFKGLMNEASKGKHLRSRCRCPSSEYQHHAKESGFQTSSSFAHNQSLLAY